MLPTELHEQTIVSYAQGGQLGISVESFLIDRKAAISMMVKVQTPPTQCVPGALARGTTRAGGRTRPGSAEARARAGGPWP